MVAKVDPREIIGVLAELFPAAFVLDPRQRKPLKVGILDDLLAATSGAVTRLEATIAVRFYCNSLAYLRASREGAVRVDLQGNEAGYVTAPEAEHARERLLKAQTVHMAAAWEAAWAERKQRAAQPVRRPPSRELIPRAPSPQIPTAPSPSPAAAPRRLGLKDLRTAWAARNGNGAAP